MSSNTEPVEISTRIRPGEWDRESLAATLASYEQKLRDMGAPEDAIRTWVDTPDDGSASVRVAWLRDGTEQVFTASDFGRTNVPEAETSRGHGEAIPQGEVSRDSKGLGAIYGDADRSAIDEPPSTAPVQQATDGAGDGFRLVTEADGTSYVEDLGSVKQ